MAGELQRFSDQWGFTHTTTTPYFPQTNREAERAVQEAKKILFQKDPFLALLTHRSTPTTSTGVSPVEFAMGRRFGSTLPTLSSNLHPPLHDRAAVSTADTKKKVAHKHYFHKRHGARSLPELQPGDIVLQKLDDEKGWSSPAMVLNRFGSRSYMIETPSGR